MEGEEGLKVGFCNLFDMTPIFGLYDSYFYHDFFPDGSAHDGERARTKAIKLAQRKEEKKQMSQFYGGRRRFKSM